MSYYLITSALPYINGIKHLGNLVGSMLPADLYARHLRQQGERVLYICGTDEHGTPAELAARAKGVEVKSFCEDMYARQKEIYERFNLSFDYFGRSSNNTNHKITQEVFLALEKNGFIEEKEVEQYYSEQDGRYLPDRFVTGICPHCGDTGARGDQCEACGRLLDPKDLIQPRSSISGAQDLEFRKSKHLFLKLSTLQARLEQWVKTKETWPTTTRGIAKKWFKEGLEDRCITRDTAWGVPVPKQGYEGKRFYVWFDAPMAYIAMTKDWAEATGEQDQWRNWWCGNEAVTYDQFMAKDNVPFHAIFWPAMVLGSELGFKMPDHINGVNWLTYEGGKFSTSNNRGIFTDQALEEFDADYWRYYLASVMPETSDSDFTFVHFAQTINADLVNNLGNFVSRACTLIVKNFDGKLEKISPEFADSHCNEFNRANELLDNIDQYLRNKKILKAVTEIKALWSYGNEYITANQPWKLVKTDKQKAHDVLAFCFHLIKISFVASNSLIPSTSQNIVNQIGCDLELKNTSFEQAKSFINFDRAVIVKKPKKLFSKISEEEVQVLNDKYGCG
ncbi:methionine--tRNA ligase [Marinimicrobium locisalis]|uniref:methionine--tRNA ligase n=1 Tax=Marinimicrobium locisalis TaxID=546022 RepID=UPI00322161F2